MTVEQQPARGSARVDAVPRAVPAPPVLRLQRQPDRLGPLHVVQLLLAQATVIGILAVLSQDPLVVAGAAGAGLLLLAVLLSRQQGRWWLERQLLRLRHQRRRHAGPARTDPDPRMAALQLLAPELTVDNIDSADGFRIGVGTEAAGWFAAAVISTRDAMGGDAGPELPLDTLVGVLAEAEQPGASLQVVTQTVPMSGMLDPAPANLAQQSYRQLIGRFGRSSVPQDQTTWLVVRLDSRTLAELGVEPGMDPESSAPAVVAALIRRVGKSLQRAGVSCQVLDADSLISALARSCDVEDAGPEGVGQPREEWSMWHSHRFAHRSFWIRDWPPFTQGGPLLDWLTAVPAAMSIATFVLTPSPEDDTVILRGLLRVAAPAEELGRICKTLQEQARNARATLFPLDGEQGPAVYASAPTGGGPR